jgi:hypothetical protein
VILTVDWNRSFQIFVRNLQSWNNVQKIIQKWPYLFALPMIVFTKSIKLLPNAKTKKGLWVMYNNRVKYSIICWFLTTLICLSELPMSIDWAISCWCKLSLLIFRFKRIFGLPLICYFWLKYCSNITTFTKKSGIIQWNMKNARSNDLFGHLFIIKFDRRITVIINSIN